MLPQVWTAGGFRLRHWVPHFSISLLPYFFNSLLCHVQIFVLLTSPWSVSPQRPSAFSSLSHLVMWERRFCQQKVWDLDQLHLSCPAKGQNCLESWPGSPSGTRTRFSCFGVHSYCWVLYLWHLLHVSLSQEEDPSSVVLPEVPYCSCPGLMGLFLTCLEALRLDSVCVQIVKPSESN